VNKGETAVNETKTINPKANIIVMKLDLCSLSSIRLFAKKVCERESRIDILINNAGVMMCPEWKTEDGFEMQFGTNHLGIYENSLNVFQ
jgi:NAD(P)-dependent dehydrogenase (short-subunit alcohol dehydrogenase family)